MFFFFFLLNFYTRTYHAIKQQGENNLGFCLITLPLANVKHGGAEDLTGVTEGSMKTKNLLEVMPCCTVQ